jgi:hypothetical protein
MLVATDKGGIRENAALNQVLARWSTCCARCRFDPDPDALSRNPRVMGTTIGTRAAIFPWW